MFATHNLLPIVLKNPCLFFFALDIEMNWLCLSATCYFAPFTSEAVKSIKVKVIYDGMLYITWHVWTEVAASKSHLLSNFSTSFHCLLLSTLFKHLLSHWQLLHSHALCPALAVKAACVRSINISFFFVSCPEMVMTNGQTVKTHSKAQSCSIRSLTDITIWASFFCLLLTVLIYLINIKNKYIYLSMLTLLQLQIFDLCHSWYMKRDFAVSVSVTLLFPSFVPFKGHEILLRKKKKTLHLVHIYLGDLKM